MAPRTRQASAREQGPKLPLLDLPQEALERVLALVTAHADRAALRLACRRTKEIVDGGVVKLSKPLTNSPLTALTRAPWRLQALTLWGQALQVQGRAVLGGEGAALLAAADWPTLHTLILYCCGLGAAGGVALAAGRWPLLRALSLSMNGIGDAGVAALAAMHMPALQNLYLPGNSIGQAGATALAAGAWPNLQYLGLEQNPIGEAGATALAGGAWPRLRRLTLANAGLGSAGVAALAGANWPALEELYLYGNAVPAGDRSRLREAFPRRVAVCL